MHAKRKGALFDSRNWPGLPKNSNLLDLDDAEGDGIKYPLPPGFPYENVDKKMYYKRKQG